MSKENPFAISRVYPGDLNAMVKNIMRQMDINDPSEAVRRINSGEWVVAPSERIWKTWKTIKLGTLKNVDEIRQALKDGRYSIGGMADDILGKPAFRVSETEQDVELVEVSNEELGFKAGASYADTCKRAFELGLTYCPAEVGPQLRLQFKDQPKGTFVVVAMEAIADSDGDFLVFYVKRYEGGNYSLYASFGGASNVWSGDVRFLFLRRKSTRT